MRGPRVLVPELLDSLPPDDPSAQGSRRDLARINGLMGNARLVAGLVGLRRAERVLEIGAGDGRLMLRVVRRLAERSPARRVALLDLQPLVAPTLAGRFREIGWGYEGVTANVFSYLESYREERWNVIVANLFVHHFEGEELSRLLGLVSERCDLFVACEPARSGFALAGTRTLGLIGCNSVTRHDARASVRAGFRGRELSSLWPNPEGWSLEEKAAPPFSHLFRAERKR